MLTRSFVQLGIICDNLYGTHAPKSPIHLADVVIYCPRSFFTYTDVPCRRKKLRNS